MISEFATISSICVENKFAASDIIAISSVFIAAMALFVAIWQTHATRKHNRLSVKPNLDFHTDRVLGDPIRITIKKKGIGPAIIEKFFALQNGDKIYLKNKDDVKKLFLVFKIDIQQCELGFSRHQFCLMISKFSVIKL